MIAPKRLARWLACALALLLGIAALYMFAAATGSLIPANPGWAEPGRGIRIHVYTNGIHTGLVLPRRNAIADWSDLVRPEHLADPRYAADQLLFGWGDRKFYLETPTWGDLSPATAVLAIVGSEASLLHVDHVQRTWAGEDMRPLTVTTDQYRAIAAAIRAQFALDEAGRSQPVPGYGPADVFYEAEGRYSALRTCNEWTGSLLRDAGVEVGVWTPFSASVMRWF